MGKELVMLHELPTVKQACVGLTLGEARLRQWEPEMALCCVKVTSRPAHAQGEAHCWVRSQPLPRVRTFSSNRPLGMALLHGRERETLAQEPGRIGEWPPHTAEEGEEAQAWRGVEGGGLQRPAL